MTRFSCDFLTDLSQNIVMFMYIYMYMCNNTFKFEAHNIDWFIFLWLKRESQSTYCDTDILLGFDRKTLLIEEFMLHLQEWCVAFRLHRYMYEMKI